MSQKQLNYPLIVSDFDGTLANSKNQVPQKVIDAINAYLSVGGTFAVCTGRILPCILPRLKQMGLSGLVVASQGCQIAEIDSGKLIKNECMTARQASEICAFLEGENVNVQLYTAYDFYSSLPEGEEHLALYESIVGLKAKHSRFKLSQVALNEELKFCKVTVFVKNEEQRELYERLVARFGKDFDVTCSANVLVEISPKGHTKGTALEFLAQKLGVPLNKTVAIGDNLNDLSMILAAGVGVAVQNGTKELKERADFIAVSNDECAVAQVIERFGYKND